MTQNSLSSSASDAPGKDTRWATVQDTRVVSHPKAPKPGALHARPLIAQASKAVGIGTELGGISLSTTDLLEIALLLGVPAKSNGGNVAVAGLLTAVDGVESLSADADVVNGSELRTGGTLFAAANTLVEFFAVGHCRL